MKKITKKSETTATIAADARKPGPVTVTKPGATAEAPAYKNGKPANDAARAVEAAKKSAPATKPDASKPAAAPAGATVTLKELCGSTPTKPVRVLLRASTIAKPGKTWTWSAKHADLAAVRELIAKAAA